MVTTRKIVELAGYKPGRRMGEGSDGVVYALKDKKGFVAKVTTSWAEAVVAQKMIGSRSKYVPKILDVCEVRFNENLYNRYDFCPSSDQLEAGVRYVIVREDLKTLSGGSDIHWAIDRLDGGLGDLSTRTVDFKNLYEQVLSRHFLSEKEKRILQSLVRFARWSYKRGFRPYDLCGSNIGVRENGNVVPRDFSRFRFMESSTLPTIHRSVKFDPVRKKAA